MNEGRALRSAALQAITALQAMSEQATAQVAELARIIDSTATPESLAADPDSPVNMQRALTTARAELAAAKEALAPFARAWSKKMEGLLELEVEVFVDPQRPERNRSIHIRDLQRANQAYLAVTIGAELLDRLQDAEALLSRLALGEDVRQQAVSHLNRVGKADKDDSPGDSVPPPPGGPDKP